VLRTLVAVLVAVPWVAWAVVRGLGLDLDHPLTALVGLTPYAAATAPLPVVLALALRRRAVAVVAAAAAVVLVLAVAPRAIGGGGAEGAGGPSLTVMSVNLAVGNGAVAAVVREARRRRVDVLSLQEVSAETLAALDRAGGRALFPQRVTATAPGAGGEALLVRSGLEVGDGDREPWPAATLDGRVRVVAVHPRPPVSRAAHDEWRGLLRALPSTGPRGVPVVLAGDFNATLDHRELRRLLGRGYVDAADATGGGLAPTWPAGRGPPPFMAIDHVLADRRLGVRGFATFAIPGSDHRGVVARLVLSAAGG
jgi:endonuclease/exonuclease/phosphatase (EEP) superfamily protein YafD